MEVEGKNERISILGHTILLLCFHYLTKLVLIQQAASLHSYR